MATSRLCRPAALRTLKNASSTPKRFASNAPSTSQPAQSPFSPRHLLSISGLLPSELTTLVRNASKYKTAVKSQSVPPHLQNRLMAQTIAIMFTKRSTRTRVSTERPSDRTQDCKEQDGTTKAGAKGILTPNLRDFFALFTSENVYLPVV